MTIFTQWIKIIPPKQPNVCKWQIYILLFLFYFLLFWGYYRRFLLLSSLLFCLVLFCFSALKCQRGEKISHLGRYIKKRHSVKNSNIPSCVWLHMICEAASCLRPDHTVAAILILLRLPIGKESSLSLMANNSSNHSILYFSGLLWECSATAEWLPQLSREHD